MTHSELVKKVDKLIEENSKKEKEKNILDARIRVVDEELDAANKELKSCHGVDTYQELVEKYKKVHALLESKLDEII